MNNLNAIAVIQARMSSTRLPGKVMFELSGKPMIWHIVERLKKCRELDKIIVATSSLNSDDDLADYCLNAGIEIFRGDLENVLSRFTKLMEIYPCKYIVRITGDCPLISSNFIDYQIKVLDYYDADMVWLKKKVNILDGQAVYSERLVNQVKINSKSKEDLEHVGSLYISNNPDQFKIIGLDPAEDICKFNYRFSVDEFKDYVFIKKIYFELYENNIIPLKKVLDFLDKNQELSSLNKNIKDSEINKNVKNNFEKWNQFTFRTIKLNKYEL